MSDNNLRVASNEGMVKGPSLQDRVLQIARICHEANRAYCATLSDYSQIEWDGAPEWQRASAIKGVQHHIDNPAAGPDSSHNSWMKEKTETGWKYGPIKDAEKKEHPCYVPYDQLPMDQKMKDYIFGGIAKSMIEALGLRTVPTRGEVVIEVNFNADGRKPIDRLSSAYAQLWDLNQAEAQAHHLVILNRELKELTKDATPEEHEAIAKAGKINMALPQAAHDSTRNLAMAQSHLEIAQMLIVKSVTR